MKCLFVALLALAVPSPARAEKIPAATFARLPGYETPKLSPSGKFVAGKLDRGGTQVFAIFSIDGSSKSTAINTGEIDVNWWSWVNEDWLIAGVGREEVVEGDTWYIRRLISISRDGSTVRPIVTRELGQTADDVLWMARDGSPRILMGLQKSIYSKDDDFWQTVMEADIATGKTRVVVPPRVGVMDWWADAQGVVRAGYGYDDVRGVSHLYYRASAKDSFREIARSGKREKDFVSPSIFLPDPGKAIAVDDHDGFKAAYEYDLTSRTLGKRIFGAAGHDIEGLIPTPAGDGLMGVSVIRDRYADEWFDPVFAKVQAGVDDAVGAGNAEIVSWSSDKKIFLVRVGAPDQAGAYYYFNTDVGKMQRLAWLNPELKNRKLAPVRTVRYKARDGLEISAVLTLPPGREGKALPLILMPHGGPSARDAEEWDWWVQFLADRGYAVVQPNYRGSTGFGTAFKQKGQGEWGLRMQDDLDDAVAYLAKEGIADAKRVCVVGASYGGYAAMRAAQRDGARYRCAVSYAGVSDLAALKRYDGQFLNGNSSAEWLKKQAPDLRLVSPLFHAADFSAPILIVHGKKDRRVPVDQSRDMVDRLKAAHKTYLYVEQPLADHFFTRYADRLQFLEQLDAFLAKYNPA